MNLQTEAEEKGAARRCPYVWRRGRNIDGVQAGRGRARSRLLVIFMIFLTGGRCLAASFDIDQCGNWSRSSDPCCFSGRSDRWPDQLPQAFAATMSGRHMCAPTIRRSTIFTCLPRMVWQRNETATFQNGVRVRERGIAERGRVKRGCLNRRRCYGPIGGWPEW